MKVKVNNRDVETQAENLQQLAEELSLPLIGIAIAVDNHLVPRMEWVNCALIEGMSVVIIKAACGG